MLQGQIIATELTAALPAQKGKSRFASAFREVWNRYWDTIGTELLLAAAGLASGLLSARLLGPQERGVLAAVVLWPTALAFLCSLSTDRAVVFFVGKNRHNISPVVGACLGLAGAQTVAVGLLGLLVIPFALGKFGPGVVTLGLVFLLCGPLTRAFILPNNLLLGTLHTEAYNLCRALPPVSYAIAITSLFLLGIPSVHAIIFLQLLGYAVAAWLSIRFVSRTLRPKWGWDPEILKGMLRYGIKGYAGDVALLMNQQLGPLLMSLFVPSAELGIYVAAVAISSALLIVPNGIGLVTLATGCNSNREEASHLTARSLQLASVLLLPAGAALWLLVPVLVPSLLGVAFTSSILPSRILIPGMVARGLTVVLYEFTRSVDRPEIASYGEILGASLTAILLFLLLRPYGAVGAAIASSGAYLAALVFALFYWRHSRALTLSAIRVSKAGP